MLLYCSAASGPLPLFNSGFGVLPVGCCLWGAAFVGVLPLLECCFWSAASVKLCFWGAGWGAAFVGVLTLGSASVKVGQEARWGMYNRVWEESLHMSVLLYLSSASTSQITLPF